MTSCDSPTPASANDIGGTILPTAAVATSSTGLTLSHLLQHKDWDLPEWNGPTSDDPHHILDKLGDIDCSLALLQRYRNTLRPIYRLAPDILLLIFQELAEDEEGPFHPSYGSNPWIHLAHVCHRWRLIALACPLLWTRISTRYPDAALTCLERSADAPLSLCVSSSATTEATSQVISAALPHAARLRQVYLPSTFTEGDALQTLMPILKSPAPLLETLQVYKVRMDSDKFTLPKLFEGETPRLTHLKLRYACPEPSSLSYASLKRLFIKGKKNEPLTLELSQLCGILEASPQLEMFKMQKAKVVPSSSKDRDETGLIHLPKLRLLHIDRSSASVISDLFSRLVIPDCATYLVIKLERAADFTFKFGMPSELSENQPLQGIKRLSVEYHSSNDTVFIHGHTPTQPFQISAYIPSNSDIGEMPTVAGSLLTSIVRTLDVSMLEEFVIGEQSYHRAHMGLTRRTWCEILERMPTLHSLHIRIGSFNDSGLSRTILSALASPREVSGKLLCPVLNTLTVTHDRTWSSLHCYLMAQERAKGGRKLKRVSIRSPCYENFEDIEDTDLPSLKQVIEQVDLDPPNLEKPVFPEYAF